MEIAKLRSTVDEGPCDPPDEDPCVPGKELDEDDDAGPDVVPVLPVLPVLLVRDVDEIVDEISEGSRTSKLSRVKLKIFQKDDNLHEHINDSQPQVGTGWDGYSNRMFLIHSTGPLPNNI